MVADLGSNAASEAVGGAAGELSSAAGVELSEEQTGMIGDMAGSAVENEWDRKTGN